MTDETKKAHEAGARIVELKMKKSRCKAAFTRTKNKLNNAINDEESSEELMTELIEKLEIAMDEGIQSIENVCKEYEHQVKTTEMLSTLSEVEEIEKEYDKVMQQYHELMIRVKHMKVTKLTSEKTYGSIYMEDIEKFPAMSVKNDKSLDKFSDLLDIAVINIKEVGFESELGTGMMYLALQKKLPEPMLTSYHRWIVEYEKKDSVETLRDYVIQETEYHETKHGIGATGTLKPFKQGNRSFHTAAGQARLPRFCKICTGSHDAWECEKFKSLSVCDRWNKAKELKLCFRCLKDNHRGIDCRNFRKCGINGCKKTHDRLLHVDSKSEAGQLNPMAAPYQPENVTSYCKTNSYITLRTIPVILNSKDKSVKVNALLDDASTKTYINADIAAELGRRGEIRFKQCQ